MVTRTVRSPWISPRIRYSSSIRRYQHDPPGGTCASRSPAAGSASSAISRKARLIARNVDRVDDERSAERSGSAGAERSVVTGLRPVRLEPVDEAVTAAFVGEQIVDRVRGCSRQHPRRAADRLRDALLPALPQPAEVVPQHCRDQIPASLVGAQPATRLDPRPLAVRQRDESALGQLAVDVEHRADGLALHMRSPARVAAYGVCRSAFPRRTAARGTPRRRELSSLPLRLSLARASTSKGSAG